MQGGLWKPRRDTQLTPPTCSITPAVERPRDLPRFLKCMTPGPSATWSNAVSAQDGGASKWEVAADRLTPGSASAWGPRDASSLQTSTRASSKAGSYGMSKYGGTISSRI